MKIVTLCGSMRFAREMQDIALELEIKRGCCAIPPIVDNGAELSECALNRLSEAHFKKIDIADVVYIVNIDGYIGASVSREIEYAKSRNKEIIYHESF